MTCLLGLSISAKAQEASNVIVTVPFEFVVAGVKTMPAGTYSIGRVSHDTQPGLIIRSYDNSVLLLPIAVDEPSTEQARLAFEHVGGTYFLSKIETPAGVYTIAIRRAITRLGQTKDHSTVFSSGN